MVDKYLSFEEFLALAEASLQNEFPQLNPAIEGNWATAFAKSICSSGIAVQSQVKDLERELFPQTATAQYLDRWGAYENLTRNIATKAIGPIVQSTTTIPVPPDSIFIAAGSRYFADANNQYYVTTNDEYIHLHGGNLVSITHEGSGAMAVITENEHGLIVGSTVTFADVVSTPPNILNGEFEVTEVTGAFTFKYFKALPRTDGTGGTYSAFFTRIDVEAEEAGVEGNLSPGIIMSLTSPLPNVADAVVVNSGIHGGLSEETNEEYRSRIIQSRSELEGVFTIEQIRKAALTVIGNTRAFVVTPNDVEQPGAPLPGQVEAYIFRDDDLNPLPSATVLAQTKEAIIKYGKLPANTSADDVFVFAPTLIITNFTFSFISPNTPGMQAAVEAQLKAFFEDSVEFGTDVPQTSYLAAIQNTQDTTNGEFLKTFNLTSPVGDIIIAPGEIAYLGTVTFT